MGAVVVFRSRRFIFCALVGAILASGGFAVAASYATVTHFDDAWWIDFKHAGMRPSHFHRKDYADGAAACLNGIAEAEAAGDIAARNRAVKRLQLLSRLAEQRAQSAKAAFERAVKPFHADMPDLDAPPSSARDVEKWEQRRDRFFDNHPVLKQAKTNDDQAGHDSVALEDLATWATEGK